MKACKSTLSLSGGQAQGDNERHRQQPGWSLFLTGEAVQERKSCIRTVFYGKLTLYANAPMTTEGRIPVEHKPEKAPESGCCLPGNAGFGGLL